MSQYDNSSKGVLFVEEDKKSEKHPDFKGTITMPDGKEYWVSGWKRIGNNKKFISLALDPKEPKTYKNPPRRENEGGGSGW